MKKYSRDCLKSTCNFSQTFILDFLQSLNKKFRRGGGVILELKSIKENKGNVKNINIIKIVQ